MVKVKEGQGLLQRFIIISRSRQELNVKECIGNYEFGVIPRSLLASHGSLLLAYDKASILHDLEKLTPDAQQIELETNETTNDELSEHQSMHVPLQSFATARETTNMETTTESTAYRVISH